MSNLLAVQREHPPHRVWVVAVGMLTFALVFMAIDNLYVRFVSPYFPPVGTSAELATLYGIVSRLHVFIPSLLLVMWQPRRFGFQPGKIRLHWRMLLIVLVINGGVIGAYVLLTRSGTPYSGKQWLLTEMITVPLIEETLWRGIVFTGLLLLLRRSNSEATSQRWAIWLSGVAFGILHLGNALFGVSVAFVAIQALNAILWGLVYGYTRSKTESIYPAIVLHAAMNLIIALA